MRTDLGQYHYEVRTGILLHPDRTIIIDQQLYEPDPKQHNTYAFVQLLCIKTRGDASTGKVINQGQMTYYQKGKKTMTSTSPIIDCYFSVTYHLTVENLFTFSKIANLTDRYF